MHFLPDVYVTCETCKGKRYNRETLEVLFKGKTIADVLDMTVEDAEAFFAAVPAIREKMTTLMRVGLGYVKVGQQATTLSGGEAQRVKLSKELAAPLDRAHPLHPRRADHRPALRGHPQAARGAARAGRPGQHRGGHRAQPRRHQDRRLDHRHRPRRRRRRRQASSPPARRRRSPASPAATPATTSPRCSRRAGWRRNSARTAARRARGHASPRGSKRQPIETRRPPRSLRLGSALVAPPHNVAADFPDPGRFVPIGCLRCAGMRAPRRPVGRRPARPPAAPEAGVTRRGARARIRPMPPDRPPPPLPEPFAGWFARRGWQPHPHQLALLARARRPGDAAGRADRRRQDARRLPAQPDRARRRARRPGLHTLYVSPLKALAADIRRNLGAPLAEMGLRHPGRGPHRRHRRGAARAPARRPAAHPADHARSRWR